MPPFWVLIIAALASALFLDGRRILLAFQERGLVIGLGYWSGAAILPGAMIALFAWLGTLFF